MKFEISEFKIEELYERSEKIHKQQESVIKGFKDEKLRENIRGILSDREKHYIRYVITLNDKFVGEITFSGKDELKPEIGIEIQEGFRNKGIGYEILKELIIRLSEVKNIEYFIYTVRNDNTASIRLVEKLGGVRVREYKPVKQFELAFFTYHILPLKKKLIV